MVYSVLSIARIINVMCNTNVFNSDKTGERFLLFFLTCSNVFYNNNLSIRINNTLIENENEELQQLCHVGFTTLNLITASFGFGDMTKCEGYL